MLIGEARDFLNSANVDPANQTFELSFLGRYEYQSCDIEVPFDLPAGGIKPAHIDDLRERFHKIHERIYSIRNNDDLIEFTRWNVRAIGKRPHQDIWRNFKLRARDGPAKPKGMRKAYVQENLKCGYIDLPVYELTSLGAGAIVKGPSLIEAETYTAFLPAHHDVEVDAYGNLLVDKNRNRG